MTSPEKDRDGDGLPEWDHAIQMGFDDDPIFSRWQEWSAGLDITTAETPAMGAMLYREILSLINISTLINQTNLIPDLENALERLRTALTSMWNPGSALYHDVDRDTHLSQPAQLIGRFTGNGTLSLNKSFQNPTRIVIHIHTGGETVRQGQFFVHGTGVSSQSRIERITGDKFKWLPGRGNLTGERLYTSLDKIEIQNLSPRDELIIYSAGYYSESLASLLPLWAGLPDQDQAKNMVEATITFAAVPQHIHATATFSRKRTVGARSPHASPTLAAGPPHSRLQSAPGGPGDRCSRAKGVLHGASALPRRSRAPDLRGGATGVGRPYQAGCLAI